MSTNCHYSPACTVKKYFLIDVTVLNHNKKLKQPIQYPAVLNKGNSSIRNETCQEPEFHKNSTYQSHILHVKYVLYCGQKTHIHVSSFRLSGVINVLNFFCWPSHKLFYIDTDSLISNVHLYCKMLKVVISNIFRLMEEKLEENLLCGLSQLYFSLQMSVL